MKRISYFLSLFILIHNLAFGQSRWYSYNDYCKQSYATTDSSFYPLWRDHNVLWLFGSGYDTLGVVSNALVLDPQFYDLNSNVYYFGQMQLSPQDVYSVDSVKVYGRYNRNPSKPGVVDTLRVSLVYSDNSVNSNLPEFYFNNMMSNYGFDTVYFKLPFYDSVKRTLRSKNALSPQVVVVNFPLTTTNWADSNANGIHCFQVDIPNTLVGANQKVAVSTTFLSGDNVIPYDTVWNGTSYKYNVFLAYYYKMIDANSYPAYEPTNRTCGYIQTLPLAFGWNNNYIPMYAFPFPTFPMEHPHIDIKLNCSTCLPIIPQITSSISSTYQPVLNSCFPLALFTTIPPSGTVQWLLNGSPIPGATLSTLLATQSGIYQIQSTYNGNTYLSNQVQFNGPPTVTASVTNSTVCAGDTVIFNANGAVSYQWTNGVVNGQPYIPFITNLYVVTGTDVNGCTGTTSLNVVVNPMPTPVITQSGTTLSTTQSFVTYQWFENGNPIASATSQQYSPTVNGIYSVQVTNSYGCDAMSAPYTYLTVETNQVKEPESIVVYPNPASDELFIKINHTIDVLSVYDMQGSLMYEQRQPEQVLQIPIKQWPTGMYRIKVIEKQQQSTYTFTKQ